MWWVCIAFHAGQIENAHKLTIGKIPSHIMGTLNFFTLVQERKELGPGLRGVVNALSTVPKV